MMRVGGGKGFMFLVKLRGVDERGKSF